MTNRRGLSIGLLVLGFFAAFVPRLHAQNNRFVRYHWFTAYGGEPIVHQLNQDICVGTPVWFSVSNAFAWTYGFDVWEDGSVHDEVTDTTRWLFPWQFYDACGDESAGDWNLSHNAAWSIWGTQIWPWNGGFIVFVPSCAGVATLSYGTPLRYTNFTVTGVGSLRPETNSLLRTVQRAGGGTTCFPDPRFP